METINLGAFLTFVFVASFTPGPNNITCSSMGILYGYRRTLRYIAGILAGFTLLAILSGLVSGTLYALIPSLEGIMRLVGAAYILWLAYKTWKSSYQFSEEESPALGFANGFLLQLFNPKGLIYMLTIYTTFLASITDNFLLVVLSAIFLALVAFSSTSTWTLMGAGIKRFLRNPQWQRAINAGLALLLAITAVGLSGIFGG